MSFVQCLKTSALYAANLDFWCIIKIKACFLLSILCILDFRVSTAILTIIDIFRRWCKLNFRPLPGLAKSGHFPKRIDARRQYFYFWYKHLGIFGRKWLAQPFPIMIWIYYYLLNGIRLDLGLDNSSWIQKYLTMLGTTLKF